MKVILLEKMPNLGDIGKIVSVKSGYARNYLLPSGFAKLATEENIKEIEALTEQLLAASKDKINQAKAVAMKIANIVLEFNCPASDEGKLFGSIGVRDIEESLKEQEIAIKKKQISLVDGVFRVVGDYKVKINLHPDISETLNISIKSQD